MGLIFSLSGSSTFMMAEVTRHQLVCWAVTLAIFSTICGFTTGNHYNKDYYELEGNPYDYGYYEGFDDYSDDNYPHGENYEPYEQHTSLVNEEGYDEYGEHYKESLYGKLAYVSQNK